MPSIKSQHLEWCISVFWSINNVEEGWEESVFAFLALLSFVILNDVMGFLKKYTLAQGHFKTEQHLCQMLNVQLYFVLRLHHFPDSLYNPSFFTGHFQTMDKHYTVAYGLSLRCFEKATEY